MTKLPPLLQVSRVLLVRLPEQGQTVHLDDFIDEQEHHVRQMTHMLMAKSLEIEASVDDLLGVIGKGQMGETPS